MRQCRTCGLWFLSEHDIWCPECVRSGPNKPRPPAPVPPTPPVADPVAELVPEFSEDTLLHLAAYAASLHPSIRPARHKRVPGGKRGL